MTPSQELDERIGGSCEAVCALDLLLIRGAGKAR